jgi:hypothetical protein
MRWLVLIAFVAGCGGSTAGPEFGDAGTTDASATDSATSDGAKPPPIDGSAPDSATCGSCVPDWCGCGQCLAAQIVCTRTPKPCPLGCPSACTDLGGVTCHCEADRCVHDKPADTVACYTDLDCPIGNCCSTRGASLSGTCAPNGDPCCNATCK